MHDTHMVSRPIGILCSCSLRRPHKATNHEMDAFGMDHFKMGTRCVSIAGSTPRR